MYNKIAPIILNSGKANGLSDVFVAQPDSLKENLAGKIFILAEIGGKKNESRKIWNFLVAAIEDYYYNDEKILLRDKIEGLKIENIFEAALAKTSQALGEFLLEEKIKINPLSTNITLGVIYENKLHFSSFGKNRALLLYRRGDQCEIINVEASASDSPSSHSEAEVASLKAPSLFSSVISGEIPLGSYFVFTSEALPEYLSGKEMVNIITKLPPIVAAEQIKNVLGKINTFVPFLGVIIKNTAGLNSPEVKEEIEENLTAQSSISSLNYTEQKTEQMLAPAGVINLSKLARQARSIVKSWTPPPPVNKTVYQPEEERKQPTLAPELGKIKSLNLARPDSFMAKNRISFKTNPNWFWLGFKKALITIPRLINPYFWKSVLVNFKNWLQALNKKNRLLFIGLAAVVLVFVLSLLITTWNKNRQVAQTNLNNLISQIETKQTLIDSHLLYNDEEGAKSVLADLEALLLSLPQKTKVQKNTYLRLSSRLQELRDRVQKIVKVEGPAKANDLTGLGVKSIVFASGKIYGAGDKFIYALVPNSASSSRIEISSATNLSNPQFDKKNLLYYWDQDKIIQYDIITGANNLINITAGLASDAGLTSFKLFNGNLYLVAKAKNQIYRYTRDKSGFSAKTDWLKDAADLSQTTDFAIDGSIYVLKNNGEVLKFYKNKKADYSAGALSPAMTKANKIIVGTKYLYIFEAESKRLAVLALKDGHLVNQYQISNLPAPQDVAINEEGKVAYFLDGEGIYQFALNQ